VALGERSKRLTSQRTWASAAAASSTSAGSVIAPARPRDGQCGRSPRRESRQQGRAGGGDGAGVSAAATGARACAVRASYVLIALLMIHAKGFVQGTVHPVAWVVPFLGEWLHDKGVGVGS